MNERDPREAERALNEALQDFGVELDPEEALVQVMAVVERVAGGDEARTPRLED